MTHDMTRVIVNWVPFLILIAVWIFFMQKSRGGSAFQKKCIENMDNQLAQQREITRHLSRIADALVKRQG